MLINIYLVYLGFVMICLAMDKHYKAVVNKTTDKKLQNLAKIVGTIILLLSVYLLIQDEGISMGITYFLAAAAPSIVIIAMILNYKPKALGILSVIFFVMILLFKYI